MTCDPKNDRTLVIAGSTPNSDMSTFIKSKVKLFLLKVQKSPEKWRSNLMGLEKFRITSISISIQVLQHKLTN